jgi:hypothetical protein
VPELLKSEHRFDGSEIREPEVWRNDLQLGRRDNCEFSRNLP